MLQDLSTNVLATAAPAAADGRSTITIVIVFVAVVVLAMATSVGRMLVAGIATAVRTMSELFAALVRLTGMSMAAMIVAGLLLYGMFK